MTGRRHSTDYPYLDAAGHVYLDYTGAGLPALAQLAAHAGRIRGRCFGNPHSESPASAASTELIERARLAEITEAALAGIESGASIVHNHNDEPMFTADGVHAVEPYLAAWRPVLEFGLRPTVTALEAYLELLEPSGLPWSVAVLGGDVVGCGLAELAIRRGGHVRVGLEDYAGPGEPSNLELLRAAIALIEALGRAPTSIAQARRILGVPPATRSPLAFDS
jgi:hypothetical protein